MSCIKSVNRSASVAISPESPYLAAGTMAGAVDQSFSTSAYMEIFKVDFQRQDTELELVGQSPTSEPFNRLSWSKSTLDSPFGIIAASLIDGIISLWNPRTLIRSDANADENALVGQLARHKGPVRGLEFNSIAPNHLASGSDDGEICIWDLTSPNTPTHFPPLRATASAAQSEISYLSWNTKVQHILASTSYNGTTVVWDLKKQKPVISFADSNRRRCSVLQWNPDVATQLVVASDDDSSPSLRLWDMRNIMSPVKEFVGHTKGVISMAWCPSDSSYLLTCAKDNRTICWDTVSGEIVCELPASTNWNFDIHWYPKIPGVISASSFDGKIGLYNIEACSRYGVSETDFGPASLRAPKWYKRPVGVSFGFGGKLVSFHSKTSTTSEVNVQSLVTEDGLVSRSSEFEAAIRNGDRSSLRVLCEKKSQDSESEEERETWGFLKVMFEEDGTARTKLITHLGFTIPEEVGPINEDDISQQVSSLELNSQTNNATLLYDNGIDFFNNLPSPKADTPVSTTENNFTQQVVSVEEDKGKMDTNGVEESSDNTFDEAVQRALVVGDYKEAVEQCVSVNRMADALVIAHLGPTSLWETTRDRYLNMTHSPYLKVVSAMVNNDLMSLVNTRPLISWKETLALLCTFAQKEEWTLLCDALASKLVANGNTLGATLCYICAGSIDKTVEIWSRFLSLESSGKSYFDRLQDLMEKTIVFGLATGQKHYSTSLCKLVERYVEMLASEGQLLIANEYLKLLGEDLPNELAILKDRIHVASQSENEAETATTYENQLVETRSVYDGANQPSYDAPTYRPTPPQQHPHFFVPPHSHQPNIPPPLNAEPVVKPFMPAPSPTLRNAEQYQQPQTLISHLYPGRPTTPTYRTGPTESMPPPIPGVLPCQPVITPAPTPRGFMPINSPGVLPQQQQHGFQPPSPQPAPGPAPSTIASTSPPPTIHSVDTSKVPAHQKPVISTLTRVFNETSEALGGAGASGAKKREIEDNSRKLGSLFMKLNNEDISSNAADKLVQLCQALDNGDYARALQIQVVLTTSEWDECNFWLATLKRMIKMRQSMRL